MKQSIAIDGNEANVRNRVGTGEYTYNILKNWAALPEHDFHIYLRGIPLPDMPPESESWHYHVIGPWRGWTRLAFPYHLLTGPKHDVVWSPAHYLPPFTRCPGVVTIHDLAYEFYPELFLKDDLYKLKKWTRSSSERAARIITVSEATKKDVVKLYGIPESNVSVVYNGYDSMPAPKDGESALEKFHLKPRKYLLFVGTLQPRKNIIRLIQAFRLLKEGGYKGKVVIAGKVGWMAEETLAAMKSSPDAADIVMTGYIEQGTKASLYRYADMLVMPSLYEGFGVPVLEAMSAGCPVVASDNSSLPEVVGDAGILFDALDPADIARAVTEMHGKREVFTIKGHARAKQFSWDTCAVETLKTLVSL